MDMLRKILPFFADFQQLAFPSCCLTCEQALYHQEKLVCLACRFALPLTRDWQEKDTTLRQQFGTRVPLSYALSYLHFSKKSKVQKILHHLKYSNNPDLGEMLGLWLGQALYDSPLQNAFSLIVPIPLHPNKLKKRGYNQSEVFAKGLAQSLGIPYNATAVVRNVATETQTRKNRIERLENVANIFAVVQPEVVYQQNVLVVDDVVTTGATLESCLLALLPHNPQSLSIATIAHAH